MEKEQNLDWRDIEETIGKIGSENGIIIYDVDVDGARITIEKDTDIAPFAVTLGIHGIMFHTHFVSTESESRDYVSESMKKIENLFRYLEVPENQKDEDWRKVYNDLVEKIAE